MPTSRLDLWPTILHLIWAEKPRRILDIGPGYGKAGLLIREYVGEPECLAAIEKWGPYVTPRLRAIYDEVLVADACDFTRTAVAMKDANQDWLDQFDVVLMVDVIEHMEKDRAKDLLARLNGTVIVCTPAEFFDNPPDLPPTERHISHWNIEDFGDRVVEDCSRNGAILVRLKPLKERDGQAVPA